MTERTAGKTAVSGKVVPRRTEHATGRSGAGDAVERAGIAGVAGKEVAVVADRAVGARCIAGSAVLLAFGAGRSCGEEVGREAKVANGGRVAVETVCDIGAGFADVRAGVEEVRSADAC